MTEKIKNNIEDKILALAFDLINHSVHSDRLHYYGIRGVSLGRIESYLINKKQFVKINKSISGITGITSRVRHAWFHARSFFCLLLFINDLPDYLHVNTVIYADDTVIFIEAKNVTDL